MAPGTPQQLRCFHPGVDQDDQLYLPLLRADICLARTFPKSVELNTKDTLPFPLTPAGDHSEPLHRALLLGREAATLAIGQDAEA